VYQQLKDILFFPLRLIFDHETVASYGLTSLKAERHNKVSEYCQGKVLDIGCGENDFIRRCCQSGVGVDVYPWTGLDVLCDTTQLPFENGLFDTVTMIATLNHIPANCRIQVLHEASRVLNAEGVILITIIEAVVGRIRHKLAWWDRDRKERGLKEGESLGLDMSEIRVLLEQGGFVCKDRIHFGFLALNNLIIGKKKTGYGFQESARGKSVWMAELCRQRTKDSKGGVKSVWIAGEIH